MSVTPAEVLALPLPDNDAGAATVRDYLKSLLSTLWLEKDGFSGKRPFGNSGWTYDLTEPIVEAFGVNDSVASRLVMDAIKSLA